MIPDGFQRLEEVILEPLFAEVDTDLRQGRHINQHESERYSFLRDAYDYLGSFYRQYDCELRHATVGYFYLLANDARLRRKRLTVGEMLVGQALALMYLDPETVQNQGVITSNAIVQQLAGIVGEQRLVQVLNPRRKRHDERVAQGNVREEVDKALRGLSGIGFVETVDTRHIRLCISLLRFAEPVHGLEDPALALKRLIAQGEIEQPGNDEPNLETGSTP